MRERTPASGLTLVELMVALTVLGLLSAVVIPAIPGELRGGADATARKLAELYLTARDAAVSRGMPVIVKLDLRSGAYLVAADPGASGVGRVIGAGSLPAAPGVRLSSGVSDTAFVMFGPLGHGRGDAVLARHDRIWYAITVDPWTSDIRVHRR